jgi:hypothetical protein
MYRSNDVFDCQKKKCVLAFWGNFNIFGENKNFELT